MGDGNLAESKQLNTDRVAFLWLNGRIPQWLSSKESACNARDMGLIPGWRRSPGEGHGNPLQYCYWENPTKEPDGVQSIGSQKAGHGRRKQHARSSLGESFKNTVGDLMSRTLGEEPPALGT